MFVPYIIYVGVKKIAAKSGFTKVELDGKNDDKAEKENMIIFNNEKD